MKKNNKQIKMSYEPEADVLRIETSHQPIDHAVEMGNLIVHFNKKDAPVYFEILGAIGFVKNAARALDMSHKKSLVGATK